MTTFLNRFPLRADSRLVFGGCAFIVHVWAILNLLDMLPAWMLRLTAYELAGASSYTLAFALLESLIVWAVLVALAVVLPGRWLRQDFLTQGGLLLLVTTLWAIVTHYSYELLVKNPLLLSVLAVAYLLTLLAFSWLGRRYRWIESTLRAALSRIEVLSFVYIFIDVLGVFVIIVRNL
jgi:hypothetical protein